MSRSRMARRRAQSGSTNRVPAFFEHAGDALAEVAEAQPANVGVLPARRDGGRGHLRDFLIRVRGHYGELVRERVRTPSTGGIAT